MTVWMEHPIFSGYEASNEGDIRNSKNGALIRGTLRRDGYIQLNLTYLGRPRTYYRHRFVWECFNGEVPDGLYVVHHNGRSDSDHIDNLILANRREVYEARNERINARIEKEIEEEDALSEFEREYYWVD